jgi:cobalt/nickel transport system permease protein
MSSIEGALLDFKYLDQLASGESAIHRLDARTKVLATLLFIVSVVSFSRYEVSALLPYFIFPAMLIGLANLPAGYVLKKAALVVPFAAAIGMFNPLLDTTLFQFGSFSIGGGWLSFTSIILRAILTVSAAVILVATTGLPAICRALERIGMPKAFALQLLFLYRYLVVLAEEGGRAARARELRCFGNEGRGLASYGSMLGHLLLRTWGRSERIHMAMLARGFTGSFPNERSRLRTTDLLFLLGWSFFFVVLRFHNGPEMIGSLLTGLTR